MTKGRELVEPLAAPPEYETAEPVLYEVVDGVAWITMNRPGFNNAQNGQMTYALDDCFKRALEDDSVGCIVLAGEGKHFSAGHDIGTPGRDLHHEFDKRLMVGTHTNKPAAELLYTREQEQYLGMCRRWRDIPKPTIAMISGYCLGAGLVLALRTDLRYCTADASFSAPVARFGLPFRQSGLQRVVDLIGPMHAKEMLFTARRYDAAWAERRGLVNAVAADHAALETIVAGVAAELAVNAPLTIGQVKHGVAQAIRRDAPPDEAACKALEDSCYASADYKEGRRAFMEKRKPVFGGA